MRTVTTRITAPLIVFSALMTCATLSWAQASVSASAPAAASAASQEANTTSSSVNQPASKANQLIERITIEDAGSRIDEVRFGGQTKSITVQPRGGMPAYDIQPETGVRTWKILGY